MFESLTTVLDGLVIQDEGGIAKPKVYYLVVHIYCYVFGVGFVKNGIAVKISSFI